MRSLKNSSLLADWSRVALVGPGLGAAIFLLLASVFPVRLDYRNLYDLRRTEGLDLPMGVPYLFASIDTGTNAYRFASYVLHNLAFPSQQRLWLVPKENVSDEFTGAIAVDPSGSFWSHYSSSGSRLLKSEPLKPFLRDGVVLFDSSESQALFDKRLPLLKTALRTQVLKPVPSSPLVVRKPKNAFTLTRLLRLAALFGLPFCLIPLFQQWFRSQWLGALAAVWSAPAMWIWLLSWSQYTRLASPGAWPFVAWVAAAAAYFIFLFASYSRGNSADFQPTSADSGAFFKFAIVFLIVLYGGVFLFQLDFDEDTHAHWILMARSYFLNERHIPEKVLAHILSATYPFGFAEMLCLPAWAAQLPPSQFLNFGEGTALALLAYRLGVAALHVAVFGLLAYYLFRGGASRSQLWLAGLIAFLALFPTVQGKHIGAETILFPLMAGSIIALAAARRFALPGLFALGLFVAGAGTLVKLEGGLLLLVVVLPWVFGVRADGWARSRLMLLFAAILLIATLPTILWKLTLQVPNTVYVLPSLENLRMTASEIPGIYIRAGLSLFRSATNWVLVLVGVLPLAAFSRWRRRKCWTELLVPVSIWSCCLGLPLIYVFSTLPRLWQIEVSFSRLMLLPVFSALLYCLETLFPSIGKEEAPRRWEFVSSQEEGLVLAAKD